VNNRPRFWLALLLALLAMLLYWPSLTGGPVFDDYNLLQYHPRYLTLTVHQAFTTDFWGMTPPTWRSMHYRPLALLAYAGTYHLFGMEPVAFHAVNVALHAIAVVAFFVLLDGLGFRFRVVLMAAFLFMFDPLHVEAVAWITGMMETLMVALSLASLACFVHGRRVWSVVLAAAAMLTKETALILPAMVFLIEWYRRSRDEADPPPKPAWRVAEMAALPYLVPVVICLAARGAILPRMPDELRTRFLDGVPLMASVAAAYLRMLFWPWPLAISYRLPGAWEVVSALGGLLGAAVLLWVVRRTRPRLFRDLLLACGLTLLPLAAPVLAAPLMADWLQIQDRYALLASAGACLLVTLALDSFRTNPRKKLAWVAFTLLTFGGMWGTVHQERVWVDSVTTWRHALELTPDLPFVSISLGRDLARDGRFHEAAEVIEQALRFHPRSQTLMSLLVKARTLEQMAPRYRIPTPTR
jgi:protein O-mannosyl-transferase